MQHSCIAVKEDTALKILILIKNLFLTANVDSCRPDKENMTPASHRLLPLEQDKLDLTSASAIRTALWMNVVPMPHRQFYKEIVQADPCLVCNYHYSSAAFNNQLFPRPTSAGATEKC